MTKDEIFSIWAPADSVWSPWVKPVLFADLNSTGEFTLVPEFPKDLSWFPTPAGKTALVLDLPGAEGVTLATLLIAIGYRPVPLYNALPSPAVGTLLQPVTPMMSAMVDVLPTIQALVHTTPTLAAAKLPPDAPPAFLLDANRMANGLQAAVDQFDNRSICFTTDFPSANFLLSKQIEKALLIQGARMEPQSDLAHVLRRWQDGGINLERGDLGSSAPPESFKVIRPSWYGLMFQRVLAAVGLRRAHGGGFGAWVNQGAGGG